MKFGSNLKFLRLINKESQEDIAQIVNKKRNLISNWESGGRTPIISDIIILARHYNITIEELCEKDLKLEYAKKNYPENELTREEFVKELEKLMSNSDLDEEKKKYIRKTINMIIEDEE